MAKWERELDIRHLFRGARPYLFDPTLLRRHLGALGAHAAPLHIAEVHPPAAYAGSALLILGHGFSETRADNQVTVGGKPAFVVEASPARLLVLTDATCHSGPIEVTTGGHTAHAAHDFISKPWPAPGSDDDPPPFSFEGKALPGGAAPGTIPPTGVARVLVILTYPTDLVPADLAATRNAVVTTFDNVHTFYDQVSYGTLDVQVEVTSFVPLLKDRDFYHRVNGAPGYPNIDAAVFGQLTAEAAQGAVDQGLDLDDYSVMAVLVYLPGFGVRAWGGWTQNSFAYSDGAAVAINLTTTNPLSMIIARHDADWGRAAHEFGHNLIDGGMVLGEDIYASDLVDPTQATAQSFDLMGAHDSHPMFSGFYMQQLGYYAGANTLELQWDRNPFSREYEVVAHGSAVDGTANRYNLIRIKVASGLDYYVEVRQRPPAGSTQVYDTNIPLPAGTTRTGGVIVTKAISGTVNNNQETRLVSLLHDPTVLLTNGTATDPLRALKVTVVDDQVATNPLVCKVRVEWAQQIADTPGGDFDLWVTPWGPGWETPDIWIDRQPYGSYDFTDPSGNPTGNGDEPRPLEVNHFWAKVRNNGSADAANVRLTFYSVTPPGVGDNGTWTPIQTKVLTAVTAGGSATDFVNWTPTVGQHTCLKVVAEQQLGEVTGGNNSAQENVFSFQPAAHSVPEPIAMPVAVRNPSKRRALVALAVDGVPRGYRVYLPHRWLVLEPLGEQVMTLLVCPTHDYKELRADLERARKVHDRKDVAARIRVTGWIEHGYAKELGDETKVPGAWMSRIGGITSRVEPKRMAAVKIAQDPRSGGRLVAIVGQVEPPLAGQQLRVDLHGTDRSEAYVVATTDDRGHFTARFVIGKAAQPDPARPDAALEVVAGELAPTHATLTARLGRSATLVRPTHAIAYQVQAHIFNAAELAPADSNILHLKL